MSTYSSSPETVAAPAAKGKSARTIQPAKAVAGVERLKTGRPKKQ